MNSPRRHSDHPDHDEHGHAAGNSPENQGEASPIIRLRDLGHLLTAVGYLLGYQPPEGSLVVVGTHQRQIVLIARVDLPSTTEVPVIGGLGAAWTAFAPPLAGSDADTIAIIAYTDPDWNPQLGRFADAAPLPVSDVLRVNSGRWWSLNCPDPAGCRQPACTPAGAEITDHLEVTAPMIASGAVIPGTREDLARCLQAGPTDVVDDVAACLETQPALSRSALFQDVSEAHEARTGGPYPITAGQAAVLLTALGDPYVRDACLAWTDDAAWWLWLDLIRTAPPGRIAPVATLVAVTAYQRGDGVMAAIATAHALQDTGDYRLARLIQACLNAAIPPDVLGDLIAQGLSTHPLHTATGHGTNTGGKPDADQPTSPPTN